MVKERTSILIIEDDQTFADSMMSLFQRHQFFAVVARTPAEALAAIQQQKFQYLFLDCMLPEQNGVDFAVEHQALIAQMGAKLILMSGIMTDSAFAKYATLRSKAAAFLPKPFDLTQALKIVQGSSEAKNKSNINSSARTQFYRSLFSSVPSVAEKRKLMATVSDGFGFDVIALVSSVFDLKLSGFLNLEWASGDRATITFSHGMIVAVDVADSTTKMGVLLVQNNFVLQEDLDELLASPQGSGRLGQRLIQANKLSPHAFDLVFVEQIKARLDKMIRADKVKLSFAEAEVALSGSHLDKDALTLELKRWIETKLTARFVLELIKSFEAEESVGPSSYFRIDHPICGYAHVKSLAKKISGLEQPKSFKEWIPDLQESEESLKALYFLLVKGLLAVFPQGQKELVQQAPPLELTPPPPSADVLAASMTDTSVTSISDFVTAVTKISDKDTALGKLVANRKSS